MMQKKTMLSEVEKKEIFVKALHTSFESVEKQYLKMYAQFKDEKYLLWLEDLKKEHAQKLSRVLNEPVEQF